MLTDSKIQKSGLFVVLFFMSVVQKLRAVLLGVSTFAEIEALSYRHCCWRCDCCSQPLPHPLQARVYLSRDSSSMYKLVFGNCC